MNASPTGAGRLGADATRRATVGTLAVLVVHNVTVNVLLPRAWHIPVRLVTAAVLVLALRHVGLSAAESGLDRAALRRGAGLGLRWATVVGVAVGLAAATPSGRDLLSDARFDGVGATTAAFSVLVDIPITVVVEELVFRGLLLGLLLRVLPVAPAVAVSSVAFGLWHVLPTVSMLAAGSGAPGQPVLQVLGVVAVTSVAGVAFCALRLRAGSLAAPTIVHGALNGCAYVAGWLLTR